VRGEVLREAKVESLRVEEAVRRARVRKPALVEVREVESIPFFRVAREQDDAGVQTAGRLKKRGGREGLHEETKAGREAASLGVVQERAQGVGVKAKVRARHVAGAQHVAELFGRALGVAREHGARGVAEVRGGHARVQARLDVRVKLPEALAPSGTDERGEERRRGRRDIGRHAFSLHEIFIQARGAKASKR